MPRYPARIRPSVLRSNFPATYEEPRHNDCRWREVAPRGQAGALPAPPHPLRWPHPPHTCGGHPGRRLAHASSAWRSTQRRVPAPRSAPWAPSAPARVPAIPSAGSGQQQPTAWAVSLPRVPGATGARARAPEQATPAGAWRPLACPPRQAPAAPPTVGLLPMSPRESRFFLAYSHP